MQRILSIALILVLPVGALGADDPPKPISFRDQIAPILVKKCLGCHNDQKAQNGLNIKTFALLQKGGKGFGSEVIVRGDPEASAIVAVIRPDAEPRMPLKQPALADAEIKLIEQWVKEGAKFDGPSETETVIASLVDPLKDLPKVPLKVAASDPVTSVAFAPQGKSLAAAIGKDVVLYDLATAKAVVTFAGQNGPISAVRIAPDGKTRIAVGGRPGMFGSITSWDLEKMTKRYDIRGHADTILSAAISPDSKILATCSYDRLIKLWDTETGKEIRTLKEHTDAVYDVAFSADGKALASVSADRTVKVWEVASGKKRVSLSDSTAELYAVVFAPDNKTVLAAGVDRSIRAWDVVGESGTLVRTAFAHDAAVLRLVVSPDGKTLLSSGEDNAIKIWDLATLKPRATLAGQSDWPMALAVSPDSTRLAVGRYDGSLVVLDLATQKSMLALRNSPSGGLTGATTPEASKPQLVMNASLAPPSPRGAVRGSKVKMTLSGNGVGRSDLVAFTEPGIRASILKAEKPDPNRLDVELEIAKDARVGVHRFLVQTPLGTPGSQPFAVSAEPEARENEPNDDPAKVKRVGLPATLLGAIDRPGDIDVFRFETENQQTVIFELLAKPLGSSLDGELAVLDESGKVLVEARDSDSGPDPYLAFHPPKVGTYFLRVSDSQYGGSGNHFYRIRAGAIPYVERVFPLGVKAGSNAAPAPTMVQLFGQNLAEDAKASISALNDVEAGTLIPISMPTGDGSSWTTGRKVVAAYGDQTAERSGDRANDSPAQAVRIASPGGVSGTIETEGDVDHFRFDAKKGQRVVLEVFGRRLGTPIDSVIDILDNQGRPVPRAVLRPVEETAVAFRDHPSGGRNIRLTQWNDFAEGDYVLLGRELTRIFELPRNPDDDSIMWGLGAARNNPGERVGFLETTPEHHPMSQPIYKVEIHPPGATFPAGGVPPVTLFYRNDDGGPGYGKDSHVTFDPPADGEYVVRVADVRGLGGPQFGYHMVIRGPKRDFRISLSTDNPNVPRGGTAVVTVNALRFDGFDGPIDVCVDTLGPGLTATSARIEPEVYSADLLLMAASDAPAFAPQPWSVSARANGSGSLGETIEHKFDPGGPKTGWITITPEPNAKVRFQPDKVVLRAGERVEMTLSVERSPAFQGRVPIDVRNLPRGVQVQNIGLNGVLVTEKQTERTIFIYAEPWVKPQQRPFFAVGKCEPAGTEHSSAPISLMIQPAGPAPNSEVRAP
jgi:hypothetical protein